LREQNLAYLKQLGTSFEYLREINGREVPFKHGSNRINLLDEWSLSHQLR